MAFFPRNCYNSNANAGFAPLFRLLEDFDTYSRQDESPAGRTARPAIAFQPKFDVRELPTHFELHGELAGLKKENVDIEFTDPHTLRIHGRVERTYTSSTPPASESGIATPTEDTFEEVHKHQATVEDEDAATETSSTTSNAVEKQTPQAVEKKQQPADRAKFWCRERSIGEFSRTFNFPGHVQQDAVTASLNEGILTIRIPKAPKHEARRIAIN